MIKAEFYFKVFGLTEDESGEEGYGYLKVAPKDSNGDPCEIEEKDYESVKTSMKIMINNQLGVNISDIEDITEEEYNEKVEE